MLASRMSLLAVAVLVAAALCVPGASAQAQSPSCRRPTGRDVEGPYYIPNAPLRGVADSTEKKLCSNVEEAYHRIVIYGRVLGRVSNDTRNPRCVPLRALLDIWQANEAGEYSQSSSMHCRAKFVTTEDGQFLFQSIFPGRYDDNGFRPAHLHWKITTNDERFRRTLTTQSYFDGDFYLNPVDSCPVCSSGDPSLIAKAVNIHVPEGTTLRSPLSPRRDIMTFAAEWDIVLNMDSTSSTGLLLDDELDLAPGAPYTQRLPHILTPDFESGAGPSDTAALIRELRALRKENFRLRRDTLDNEEPLE